VANHATADHDVQPKTKHDTLELYKPRDAASLLMAPSLPRAMRGCLLAIAGQKQFT